MDTDWLGLLCTTFTSVSTFVYRYKKVEEELKMLKNKEIDSLLTKTNNRHYIEDKDREIWLSDLKSLFFISDDLLDEYQTSLRVHKHNLSYAGSSKKRKRGALLPSFSPEWRLFHMWKFVNGIYNIKKNLMQIKKKNEDLRPSSENEPQLQMPNAQCGSRISRDTERNEIIIAQCGSRISRDTERNEIIKSLTSYTGETSDSFSKIAIHGTAGIGKTMLALLVFYDTETVDSYFCEKVWVSLPNACNQTNTIKTIFESMTGMDCNLENIDDILANLRGHLLSKQANKILLVIDNWPKDSNFWDTLESHLLASKKEIRVLITTRNKIVMQSCDEHRISSLGSSDCLKLLQSRAFPDISTRSQNEYLAAGESIAKKCGGSPMVAKIVGDHLKGRNEEEWYNISRDMWVLKDYNHEVLQSIMTSYYDLSYHLKLCFSYCSIFPSGYNFEKDQVIRYWMAEGLIEPDGTNRVELVGVRNFNDLVWGSFFEKTLSGENQVEKFRIPNLMHDLARNVAKYEFVGLRCKNSDGSMMQSDQNRVRYASMLHLSNMGDVNIEQTYRYVNLRTLILCGEYSETETVVPLKDVPPNLFCTLKCLRVLDLSNSELNKLPESVGELIHLRYLRLSNTQIETLPEQVNDLFNLQSLELKGCLKFERLPEEIGKLINLRHLDLHLQWEKITNSTLLVIPKGVGELESLQTLSRFSIVSEVQSCNIKVLKDLDLKGELCLLNLENVLDPADALHANLRGKEFIENLMLRWNESNNQNLQHSKRVLEHLRPYTRIKCLWIINYPGTTFPDWIGEVTFTRLETIRIANCRSLPPLGNLLHLKSLHIENVAEQTIHISSGFQSLENFDLVNLCSLENFSLEIEAPKLKKICISDCPLLQELFIHQDLLSKFEQRNCPRLNN